MTYSKTLQALIAGLVISTAVLASSQDDTESPAGMPMMDHGANMMNHQSMQQMMTPQQHQGMHMMEHQSMHHMMHMGHGMPMMEHSMGNMMNPQMMQKRMEHMQEMEQRLAKIESLLEQILEAQKSE